MTCGPPKQLECAKSSLLCLTAAKWQIVEPLTLLNPKDASWKYSLNQFEVNTDISVCFVHLNVTAKPNSSKKYSSHLHVWLLNKMRKNERTK